MQIVLPRLFDAHVHLRSNELLRKVARYTDRCCATCLVMPNLVPAVEKPEHVQSYVEQLHRVLLQTVPLLTFKLTARTNAALVRALKEAGVVAGKLYPEGVTTNSEDGISREMLCNPRDYPTFMDALGAMEQEDLVLCLHGEMPGSFCLDREYHFMPFVWEITGLFPKLRVVLEHITTENAAYRVKAMAMAGRRVAATITAHHLCLTLDDVIGDKIQPHNFCKPVPKTPENRLALRAAAGSGEPCFFLGSDSAPHLRTQKETACGCAGIFSAPVLPEVLVTEFEAMDALGKLPGFVSEHGRAFYGLPKAEGTITLKREIWTVPSEVEGLVWFRAGEVLPWRMV